MRSATLKTSTLLKTSDIGIRVAIYHCSVKVVKRSKGRSVTAAAAYRAACTIMDNRTGQQHDYSRKTGVDYTAILVPDHAPTFVQDRGQLWNTIEQVEKRKDAQLAREVEVALPRELNTAQQIQLLNTFVTKEFVALGMVADVALHHSTSTNPHAHILLTLREIDAQGFKHKNREWNQTELLEGWRKAWQRETNQALEQVGTSERIDHRTLAAQGIDRVPTVKLGAIAHQLEQQGIPTERGNLNRTIQQLNTRYSQAKLQVIELEQEYTKQQAALVPQQIKTQYAQAFEIEVRKVIKQATPLYEKARAKFSQAADVWHSEPPSPPTGWRAFFQQKPYEQQYAHWVKAKNQAGILMDIHRKRKETLQKATYTRLDNPYSFHPTLADDIARKRLERLQPALCKQYDDITRQEREKQQEQQKLNQKRIRELNKVKRNNSNFKELGR